MITTLEIRGGKSDVDWYWAHSSGDWWVEIEEIDGEDVAGLDLTDQEIEDLRVGCANHYSLAEAQSDAAEQQAERDMDR